MSELDPEKYEAFMARIREAQRKVALVRQVDRSDKALAEVHDALQEMRSLLADGQDFLAGLVERISKIPVEESQRRQHLLDFAERIQMFNNHSAHVIETLEKMTWRSMN